MIDTHAHLQDEKIQNVDEVILQAKAVGVNKIICASSDVITSKKAVELALKYEDVYATVGVHPEEAQGFDENMLNQIEALAKNKKVVAIGEIGLDYYHIFASKEKQKQAFISQIMLANKLGLPIVVHAREATQDIMQILQNHINFLNRGVCIHCFSMSTQILKQVMNMGFYISIGGIVTFKNAKNMIDVVRECNLSQLMLETDTPYLTPEPFRSKINEPQYVPYILKQIAEIRGIDQAELKNITTQNAQRFFNI